MYRLAAIRSVTDGHYDDTRLKAREARCCAVADHYGMQ